jgi:hypothetical protein
VTGTPDSQEIICGREDVKRKALTVRKLFVSRVVIRAVRTGFGPDSEPLPI